MNVNDGWQMAANTGNVYSELVDRFSHAMVVFKNTVEGNPTPFPSLTDIEFEEQALNISFGGCRLRFQFSLERHVELGIFGVIALYRRLQETERTSQSGNWVICARLRFDASTQTDYELGNGKVLVLSDDATAISLWLSWLAEAPLLER